MQPPFWWLFFLRQKDYLDFSSDYRAFFIPELQV